jgi:cytochrome b subunit of formate dehydrogenase
MFRIVSIAGFIIAFAGIVFHCVAYRPGKSGNSPGSERRLRILDVFRMFLYVLALLCFVVLTVNGFYHSLILGGSICGYLLMLQVTTGGVFAGCLAVLVLMWAHKCRFDKSDWPWLQKFLKQETVGKKRGVGHKICFWLIVLLALPVILSIVLSMFPLFGTEAQEFLLQLHRYSVLSLALVIIVHTYLIILTRTRK